MMKRILLYVSLLTASLLVAPAYSEGILENFKGRYLLVASDGDMVASAYENGKLGPIEGTDKLTVIPVGELANKHKVISVNAPNSVAGPPAVLDTSPDGKYAFVIETWTQRPGKNDDETFKDLSFGNKLTIYDLSNIDKPVQISTHEIGKRPDAISVSHDGKFLAISYHPKGNLGKTPLGIYEVKEGRVIKKHNLILPAYNSGDRLISVRWHPRKNILALINETRAIVSFVDIKKKDETIELNTWGNEVSVGKAPFIGWFTQDGKHFLVNNLYWGPDVKNTWTEAPRGTIVNIKLEHGKNNGGSPLHSLTSQVLVGASPEGFAVSPDGRYIAAINMERSWLPKDDQRRTEFSSISLIERNNQTGAMKVLQTTPYYAILPEMAVFDKSSTYLAVTAYDHFEKKTKGGSIDFFKIVQDPLNNHVKMLVQTSHSIAVQRGAHDLRLVK